MDLEATPRVRDFHGLVQTFSFPVPKLLVFLLSPGVRPSVITPWVLPLSILPQNGLVLDVPVFMNLDSR